LHGQKNNFSFHFAMAHHKTTSLILGFFVVIFGAALINARSSPPHPDRPTNVLFTSLYLTGHFTPMQMLAERLAKDPKYKVYFISTDEAKGRITNKDITFCTIGPTPIREEALGILGTDAPVFQKIVKLFDAGIIWAKDYYRSVRKIGLNDATEFNNGTCIVHKPDWIVSDVGTWGSLLAAADLSIPVIANCATLVAEMNSMAPSYLPMILSGKSVYMDFYDRFFNLFWDKVKFAYLFMQLDRQFNQFRAEEYNLPRIQITEIYDTELYLVNTAYGFEYARLTPPFVQLTGPFLNPNPAPISSFTKEYPALVEWFSKISNDSGIIYIAFGSLVSMSIEQRISIAEGLLEVMDLKPNLYVLWSLPNDKAQPVKEIIPAASQNKFVFYPWVPQESILNDPRVLLYINHGGIGSVQQSFVFGKPQLVIPSETDTFDAAVRAVDAGAGLQLDHKAINAKMVAATSYSILTLHDKYAAAAKKVGQILLAAGGVDRATDLTKQVITLGSGDHLKLYDAHLPWYHVHLGSIVFAVLVISLFQCVKACTKICTRRKVSTTPK
jgi:UDP:flavonoid glycosyltransferase YjiC (YdhE family)